MTTFDGVPGPGEYLTMWLAKMATRSSRRTRARVASSAPSLGVRAFLVTALKVLLQLAGFGSLTYAGFTVSMLAGLIIGGLSFFVLSWLIGTPTPAENPPIDPILRNR
jgi:hypothetical protein